MIHIYCGDGKGKTTAALGLAVRAAGSGLKVHILQFLKGNTSSEYVSLKQISNISITSVVSKVKFIFNMTQDEKDDLRKLNNNNIITLYDYCINNNVKLLVLDEALGALETKLLDEQLVVDLISKCNFSQIELVLTGRNPSERLTELADYVSSVTKIKHPFDKNMPARCGIEM